MRILPAIVLPAIVLPALLIALPILSRGSREHKYLPLQAPASVPEAAKPGLKVLDFAPLSYYAGACARCHGEAGANYGDLLQNKSDAQLHDGIDMMAHGPGQSPLDEPQLQVMTAWHRALADGKPFAHLMKVELGEEKTILSGEATPEVKVTLKSGESSFEAVREGAGWKIEAPKGVDLSGAEIVAEKAGAKPEAK